MEADQRRIPAIRLVSRSKQATIVAVQADSSGSSHVLALPHWCPDPDQPDSIDEHRQVIGRRSANPMPVRPPRPIPDPETVHAVRVFLDKLTDRFEVRAALLFGSRARGEHRSDSDADLAVLLRGSGGEFVATKLALADIAYDVLLETGIRIQPLPIWEEEWLHAEGYPNPRLLENIRHEGIPL